MKFKVVAEKRGPISVGGKPLTVSQVFAIRDVFDPALRQSVERRTWDSIECEDEKTLRKFFGEAGSATNGFTIVSIEQLDGAKGDRA